MLMQDGRPLAYHGQALKGKNLHLSTYEKELLALVVAVKKWRPYLLGKPLLIKTDQQALKILLDQKVGKLAQQKWIAELMGYMFQVEYKKWRDNKVADALSREEPPNQDTTTLFMLSFPHLTWLEELQQAYVTDPDLVKIIQGLQNRDPTYKAYAFNGNVLLYKDRVVLSPHSSLKSKVLLILKLMTKILLILVAYQ